MLIITRYPDLSSGMGLISFLLRSNEKFRPICPTFLSELRHNLPGNATASEEVNHEQKDYNYSRRNYIRSSSVALRNALRKLVGNSLIEPEWFAKFLKMSDARSRRLAHDLQAEGLLEKDKQYPKYLALTKLGHRFTTARATQPMNWETADRLRDGAICAAKDINADGSMTDFVEELYVFGSYLSDRHEIGDLDLGVKLGRRLRRLTNEQ